MRQAPCDDRRRETYQEADADLAAFAKHIKLIAWLGPRRSQSHLRLQFDGTLWYIIRLLSSTSGLVQAHPMPNIV